MEAAEMFSAQSHLKEEMEYREWSFDDMALKVHESNTEATIFDFACWWLLSSPMSSDLAKAIGEAIGTSAGFWSRLDANYIKWSTPQLLEH